VRPYLLVVIDNIQNSFGAAGGAGIEIQIGLIFLLTKGASITQDVLH
jgi:hypothetical protein